MTTELRLAAATLSVSRETLDRARRLSRSQPRSERWVPLKRDGSMPDGAEHWANVHYSVTVRRYPDGWPLGHGPWAKLGISADDGLPHHDWREFQRIKNELVGPDWEAIELYPAERRLVDPSNYFILWCAPNIPMGMYDGRVIATPENCCAPQRGWRPGEEPIP